MGEPALSDGLIGGGASTTFITSKTSMARSTRWRLCSSASSKARQRVADLDVHQDAVELCFQAPVYFSGLIGPGNRKSIEPIAERFAPDHFCRALVAFRDVEHFDMIYFIIEAASLGIRVVGNGQQVFAVIELDYA
jgi:hypothetical protein